jgi:hypothetical protein
MIARTILWGSLLACSLLAEVASPTGKAFHRSSKCMAMVRVKAPVQLTPDQARAKGLKPCGICYRAKKAGCTTDSDCAKRFGGNGDPEPSKEGK